MLLIFPGTPTQRSTIVMDFDLDAAPPAGSIPHLVWMDSLANAIVDLAAERVTIVLRSEDSMR